MTGEQRGRVAIAEDSELLRRGLVEVLGEAGWDVAGAYDRADEVIALVASGGIDVVVLDIRMPPTFTDEGIACLEELKRGERAPGVLLLSMYADPDHVMRAMAFGTGGIGYLLKDRTAQVDVFLGAVEQVARGGSAVDAEIVRVLVDRRQRHGDLAQLTTRERAVLSSMAEGRSNRAIASALFLNPKTIENHINRVFTKLDLPPTTDDHRRVMAVLRWLDAGRS